VPTTRTITAPPRVAQRWLTPKGPRLAPYQQGQLDGLCGVYALVNAVRLATVAHTSEFDDVAWQDLFCALMSAVEETVGTVTAFGCGINEQRLRKIAEAGITHMLAERGIALRIRGAIRRGEAWNFDCIVRRLSELAGEAGCAVLIGLAGYLNHWTVLRGVTQHCLPLFDSSGYARVRLANCRKSKDWELGGAREYLIKPKGVLLLTAGSA
jgi:hypothetical protein